MSHLANLTEVDSTDRHPNQAMMEDYGVAPVSSPAEAGRSFSAGAVEAAVLNSGGGGGGGCKTVRFQSRPKKLSNINEDSR